MGLGVYCHTLDGAVVPIRNVGPSVHAALQRWPVRMHLGMYLVSAVDLRSFAAQDIRAATTQLAGEATSDGLDKFDAAILPAREAFALADALDAAGVPQAIVSIW